jgi:hypothetical protein
MKSITINRRKLAFWSLLILILLALLVVQAVMKGARKADASVVPPETAATTFTRAFYTLDYRDQAGWLAKLQPMATTDGNTLLKDMVAPLLWPKFTSAQTVSTPDQLTVKDNGLKAEGKSKLGAWQIRALTIKLAPEVSWPDAHEFDTNILLALDGGQWKFASFLDDASVKIYQQKSP